MLSFTQSYKTGKGAALALKEIKLLNSYKGKDYCSHITVELPSDYK